MEVQNFPGYFEWAGSLLGMLGATFLAIHHPRLAVPGWLCFLLANFAMIVFSYMAKTDGLLLQQSYFVFTSLLGLYRAKQVR